MGDRDERGRFTPGHSIRGESPGRPRTEDAEKLRAALSKALDNGTLQKWTKAMRGKIEKGNPWATEFVWERIEGKLPDSLDVAGDITIRVIYDEKPGSTPTEAASEAG